MFLSGLALIAALQQPTTPAQVAPGSATAAPAAAAAPAPAAQVASASKPICHRIVATGSRLGGETICLTAQQWRERAQADSQNLSDMQNRNRFGSPN